MIPKHKRSAESGQNLDPGSILLQRIILFLFLWVVSKETGPRIARVSLVLELDM